MRGENEKKLFKVRVMKSIIESDILIESIVSYLEHDAPDDHTKQAGATRHRAARCSRHSRPVCPARQGLPQFEHVLIYTVNAIRRGSQLHPSLS